MSGLREFLAELRVSVPVTQVAKWKTTVQLVAIGFLIAGPAGDKIFACTTAIRPGRTVDRRRPTLYTGYDYFRAGIAPCDGREMMKLLYFAWVRERMGRAEEEVAFPPDVATVRDLIGWLEDRDEGGRLAFTDPRVIRAAADQEHVPLDHPLAGVREMALFPPVTGG